MQGKQEDAALPEPFAVSNYRAGSTSGKGAGLFVLVAVRGSTPREVMPITHGRFV